MRLAHRSGTNQKRQDVQLTFLHSRFAPVSATRNPYGLFWLKKLLGTLISPLPMGLGLIAVGVWLRWRGQRPQLSRGLLMVGVALPLIASNHGLSGLLVRQLEDNHPAYPLVSTKIEQELSYIAVLGGGHADNPTLPHLTQLGDHSRARLVEAVRLTLLHPDATLIVCGPRRSRGLNSHAAVLAGAARELGVAADRIVELPDARDTHDEVVALHQLTGSRPGGLVTSAWHMPRAMGLAEKAGLNVVACPADYLVRAPDSTGFASLKFSLHDLDLSSRAIREFLGLAWTKLRGQR